MSETDHLYDVTADTFATQVLEASKQVPVLVDFWADWCGPCRSLMPVLAGLVESYQGAFLLAKVNTDQQPSLAAEYGVRSLPTVKVFKNGEVIDEFMGAQSEGAIRKILDRHIEHVSDKLVQQASEIFAAGDSDQALAILQQAAEMEPDRSSVKIEQARLLIKTGQTEPAQAVINTLPAEVGLSDEVKKLNAELEFLRIAGQAPDQDQLEEQIAADPDDLQTRYRLSAHKMLAGEYETAMEYLFEIMRRDRGFENDAGRRGLLAAFEMLGDDQRVNRYRAKMFNALH